jgi:lysophospholipid acyltransferase (LPLAT)-like uncharacterized protein
MLVWKRLARSRSVQRATGVMAAEYLRLVWVTSRFVTEPADVYDRMIPHMPVILTMWHGQHFLMPFIRRPEHRGKVLISRHKDGEINAIAAERLGIETIRGSGAHGRDFARKGGAPAFMEMLSTLKDGLTVAMTADVPKISRVCGMGIIKLSQISGRPIVPVAIATSRRIELKNWDRSAVNLPLSRGAVVAGPLIQPPGDNDAALEPVRLAVENALNAATRRAYDLADRRAGDDSFG